MNAPLLLRAAWPCGSGSNPGPDKLVSRWGECWAHGQLARWEQDAQVAAREKTELKSGVT